jgi:hypothetical protein
MTYDIYVGQSKSKKLADAKATTLRNKGFGVSVSKASYGSRSAYVIMRSKKKK